MQLTPDQADAEARKLIAEAHATGRWRPIVPRLESLRQTVERLDRPISTQSDVRQVYAQEVSRNGRYRGPLSCPQIERIKRKSGLTNRGNGGTLLTATFK